MSATLHLIEAPIDDVVSLATAKANLRVTTTDTDDLIQLMIDAVVGELDPAAGGWLGRALRPQTWELRRDGFQYFYSGSGYTRDFHVVGAIELPYPPLLSVDSVKYDDSNGVEQTLVENTGFRVIGLGSNGKASIMPLHNQSWPSSVRCDPESVRVRFTCGYEASTVDLMPPQIKQAVLLSLRHLWSVSERNLFLASEENPGVMSYRWVVSEAPNAVLKAAAESLLNTLRIYE